MTRYVVGRLAQLVVVVLGALLVVFSVLYVVADPALVILPVGTSDEVVEQFRHAHGFDQPFLVQLWAFLTGAVRGDFGTSLWQGTDALDLVLERLPATLMLALPSVALGTFLGGWLGGVAARRPDSRLSHSLSVLSYTMISVAEFWLGIMLILMVSVYLGLLPTGGYSPKPWVLIMPMFVLTLRPFARIFQLTRTTMIAEYGRQYVMTARTKGLSEAEVSRRHILQNVAIPVMTLSFFELGRVFVGTAVIVEVVFAWPGIGQLAVGGLRRGDVFLVQAVVAVAAVATASLNLIADLWYFMLDPRTRSLVKQGG